MASVFNTVPGPYCSQNIVTSTLGPGVIGNLISMIFFGIAMSEGAHYFISIRSKSDGWKLKLFVYSVTSLTVIATGIHFWLFYNIGTEIQRDLDSIFNGTFLDNFNSIPVGFIGAATQTYLALRASSLFTKKLYKYIFFVLSGLPIFTGLLGAIMYAVVSFLDTAGMMEKALPFTYPNSLTMWLLGSALADVVVTIFLIFSLRSRIAGFKASTDQMLRRLIFLAVESASYTAICAFIPAMLVVFISKTAAYVAVYSAFIPPLSSLYLLSLFKNLNARDKIRLAGDRQNTAYPSRTGLTTSPTSANFRRSSKVNSKTTLISTTNSIDSGIGSRRVGPPLIISYQMEEERFEEDGDEKETSFSPRFETRFEKN